MSGASSRLRNVLGHLLSGPKTDNVPHHFSHLSPTHFLERAAAIEPNAEAVYHVTASGEVLRRSYIELADRARGLAYYLRKKGFKRVGLLAPNTPAFLEAIYGIAAAGGVMVPVNYRLKPEDIAYIMDFAEVDSIIADAEYEALLDMYRKTHPSVPVIVDLVGLGFRGQSLIIPVTDWCQGQWWYSGQAIRSLRRRSAGRAQP
jgi:acyl-CoA synthetase (AMP-forming)/AMP-acid ligase II